MSQLRKYDSTLARIAGNIAAGFVGFRQLSDLPTAETIAHNAVVMARLIIAEIERTELPQSADAVAGASRVTSV